MEVSAAMVKELRERTGAGMMDCKRALQEAGGDIESAIEAMRKSGIAKAAKKSGRIAAEGVIVLRTDPGSARAALVEVNSETDFVAKDVNFSTFADAVADRVLESEPADVEKLSALPLSGASVEESRQQLVAKIGENVAIRRFVVMRGEGDHLGAYLHGGRIGVLVDVQGGDDDLARDIAMHVAASRPACVAEKDVPPSLLDSEREVYLAQASQSGKPPEIVEKMVKGRLAKFVQEVTLLGQPFVKNPDLSVAALLKDKGASVLGFVRFEVGEGIEKQTADFASEVMAQARGA